MAIRPQHIAVTVLLTMLTALGPISTDLYLPSLPDIQSSFDTDVPTVQLTLSVYMVAFAISQLFGGALSDKFGRRPVLIAGTGIYFVASIFCIYASSIEALIAGRLFQAIGACAGIVVSRAVIRDVYKPVDSAKMLSLMGSAMSIAPAAGPILGGVVTVYFGWHGNFAMLSAYGGACLIGLIFLLAETNQNIDPHAIKPKRMLANFKEMLSQRTFRGYMLASLLTYSGLFAWISGSSFVFIEVLQLDADEYGFVFAAMVLGYMVSTQYGGRNVQKVGIPKMIFRGAVLETVGGLLMLIAAISGYVTVASILIPMMLYSAGMGLVLPNSMAGGVGPFPKMAGAASSLMGFMQYAGATFIGIAVGYAYNGSAIPMAFAIAAMGIASLLAYLFIIRSAEPDDTAKEKAA